MIPTIFKTFGSRHPNLLFAGLLAVCVLALAFVFTPAWVIQPFRAQSRSEVAWSFWLRRWSPAVTVVLAGMAGPLTVWLWPQLHRKRTKAVALLCLALTVGTVALSRWNHFETMFHPLPQPGYAPVAASDFVADSDMVLAVAINGDRVAYPVRQLAYHHIVQDVVGGAPLAVTY
ncbi:MAG: DUF3179 domain-containing protein [Blastocatellia bacterium]|nr:DUF3179 domain-containing protein [Blastocatellia bacterium]